MLYLRLTGFELSESTVAAATFVRSLTTSSCSWTGTSGLSSAATAAVDWTGGTTWTQADMCRRCVRCDRCSGVRAVVVLWCRSTWAYTGSLSERALWERRRDWLESRSVYGKGLKNFSIEQSGRHRPTKRDYTAVSNVYCISRKCRTKCKKKPTLRIIVSHISRTIAVFSLLMPDRIYINTIGQGLSSGELRELKHPPPKQFQENHKFFFKIRSICWYVDQGQQYILIDY